MGEFIVNTPSHKRWWLPDGVHTFNSVIYGDWMHQSIRHERKNELKLSLPSLDLRKDNWKELAELAQELANKKFPAKRERELADWQRSYRK